jgi:hypothetical protein
MDIIIFGKTSDDRGTQLEILTKNLLKSLGFTNVVKSEIGSGGHEIDVTAEISRPGINSSYKQMAICECKAMRNPISTNDWMKFLGKIFSQEAGGDRVYGCFIALNGANGNVRGQYRALQNHRKDIQLVSGDDLIQVLGELYNPSNVESIQAVIAKLTERKLLNLSLCYYDQELYWLSTFGGNVYSLLDKVGSFIELEQSALLQQIVADTMDLGTYVALEEEKASKERRLIVEKYIISMFLLSGKRYNEEQLLVECNSSHGRYPTQELFAAEVSVALDVLINSNIVIRRGSFYYLKILQKNHSQQDVIATYRWLLDELIIKLPLGCKRYQSFINTEFMQTFSELQGHLPIPEKEQKEWMKVLQISPSCLRWALYPDPYIIEHRLKFDSPKQIDASDIAYVSQTLALMLSKDFVSEGLSDYFNDIDIIELESAQNLKFKSSNEILGVLNYKERLRLGLIGEHKQVIVLRVLPDLPESWESIENTAPMSDN